MTVSSSLNRLERGQIEAYEDSPEYDYDEVTEEYAD